MALRVPNVLHHQQFYFPNYPSLPIEFPSCTAAAGGLRRSPALRVHRQAAAMSPSPPARTSCLAGLEGETAAKEEGEWGKVSAVLFDMDGVLCNSEHLSRLAAVDMFAEMGFPVTTDDFVPFMGTGKN